MRLILASILIVSGFQAKALTLHTESIPYYGETFYNEVRKGDRDTVLIDDIRTVLTKKHQRNSSGMDTIVDHCDRGARGCYVGSPGTELEFAL